MQRPCSTVPLCVCYIFRTFPLRHFRDMKIDKEQNEKTFKIEKKCLEVVNIIWSIYWLYYYFRLYLCLSLLVITVMMHCSRSTLTFPTLGVASYIISTLEICHLIFGEIVNLLHLHRKQGKISWYSNIIAHGLITKVSKAHRKQAYSPLHTAVSVISLFCALT